MIRKLVGLALVALFLLPDPALATGEEGTAPPPQQSFIGSPLLWGAFSLLNGALLTSSIIDLKFYNDRAAAIKDEGGNATAYWDASSREKVIIGISSISLIFSLAALRMSFQKPETDDFTLPALGRRSGGAGPAAAPEEGNVEVISHEGRIRYDTLFTAAGEEEVIARGRDGSALLGFNARSRIDTVAVDPGWNGDEAAESAAEEAPAAEAAAVEGANDETVTDAAPGAGDSAEAASVDVAQEGPAAGAPAHDPIVGIIESLPAAGAADADSELAAAPAESAATDTSAMELASVDEVESIPDEAFPHPHGDTGFTRATFALLPFAVHVSSFKQFDKAEIVEKRWSRRDVPFSIEERDLGPEKGIWYRVLIGNYATWEEAKAGAEKLKADFDLDYAQAVRRTGF
jgi:hypothetical protein